MAVDHWVMPGQNLNTQNNRAVFDRLNIFMVQVAEVAAEKRAKKMEYVLTHRQSLLGYGNFPRSGPDTPKGSAREKRNEPHSFHGWTAKRSGKGTWSLYNGHRNSTDGYPYPRALSYGMNINVKNPVHVVNRGGKWFSTQMPMGISPWFKLQRGLMAQDIEDAVKDFK